MAPVHYDPFALEDDPYPVYRALRSAVPLYAGTTVGRRFWALSRYSDIKNAVEDWKTFSSAEGNDLDDTGKLFGDAPAMDLADPPIHTRQRSVLRHVMTAHSIKSLLEPTVRAKVRTMISALRDREVVDIARDLAHPLPMATICGWLGYPEQDFDQLRGWHDDMLDRVPGQVELPAHAIYARDEMWAYVRNAAAERKLHPRDDLLSVLVAAQTAGRLSEGETLANAVFLFDAGIVSTSALISSSLLHLTDYPDERCRLWADPEILHSAVEEFLRFDAPFQWFTRVTTKDIALYGQVIPKGERVVLIWASGNRDERVWEDSERLCLTRPRKHHLTFSGGVHLCIGAPLARMQVRVFYEELIAQIAEYTITSPVKRRITPSERTISSLMARLCWKN